MSNVSMIDGHIDREKMTAQDALAFFKGELKEGKCSDYCLQCNSMEMAISALEKQVPKKVICRLDTHTNTTTGFCPVCSLLVHENVTQKQTKTNYCRFCGQAIDWSDTE